MAHQLARFGARGAVAHAIDHVVETGLEQAQQIGTGVAAAALRCLVIATKLSLEHTVHALDLLLFTQLLAVVGCTRTGSAAMLTWFGLEFDLGVNAATRTLEEEVCAFAASQFAFCTNKTSHLDILSILPCLALHGSPESTGQWS
ncbi:hypothetical protein GALL_491910 [mine drainage metagenome]|uniref:Uncharacterized protein n=1 Tax=mine drainage metagenome TaxID=410659 RepID=A0A1J5PN69_9ZZZZ